MADLTREDLERMRNLANGTVAGATIHETRQLIALVGELANDVIAVDAYWTRRRRDGTLLETRIARARALLPEEETDDKS